MHFHAYKCEWRRYLLVSGEWSVVSGICLEFFKDLLISEANSSSLRFFFKKHLPPSSLLSTVSFPLLFPIFLCHSHSLLTLSLSPSSLAFHGRSSHHEEHPLRPSPHSHSTATRQRSQNNGKHTFFIGNARNVENVNTTSAQNCDTARHVNFATMPAELKKII